MADLKTPLENLFLYIRDLFGNASNCTDFEKEPNNEKRKGVNYWEIDKIYDLARQAKSKNLEEIQFLLTSDPDLFGNTLLKIRRIQVPPEPIPPSNVDTWVEIKRHNVFSPTLSHKKYIERIEHFEDVESRIIEGKKFKKQMESPLFPDYSIAEILKDWVNESKDLIKEKKTVLEFESDQQRVNSYIAFEAEFNEYYRKQEIPLMINNLYDGLHRLYFEIKGKDSIKPYLSLGYINGIIGNVSYRNFLFHIPLKLTLYKQEIKIEIDTFTNKLFAEQSFIELFDEQFKNDSFNSIEARKHEVLGKIHSFNKNPVQFIFEKEFIRTAFYNTATEILFVFPEKQDIFFLDNELNFKFDSQIGSQRIRFSFSPILHTKFADSKIEISNDADCIAKKIYELRQNGKIDLVPDFFKRLFEIDEPREVTDFANNSDSRTTESALLGSASYQPVQYLFPLPFNDEQLEIAKRLYDQDAVTVKGPPGTGKSHTIANLTSHFVAQGKSVLIVSHNAKALGVIKNKLPVGIQNLAISLVNDMQAKETLKASVNAIISNISDKRNDEDRVHGFEIEVIQLKNKYDYVLKRIYELIESNFKTLQINNPFSNSFERKTATEWAKYYFDGRYEEDYFIIDEINFDVDTTLISSQIIQLIEFGKELTDTEKELYKYNFIDEDRFVDLAEFRKIESRIKTILKQIDLENYKVVNPKFLDPEFLSALDSFSKAFSEARKNPLANKIYKLPNYDYGKLKSILQDNSAIYEKLNITDNILLNYSVDISAIAGENPFELHEQINQLIIKFGESKTLGFFARKMLNKQLNKFFECKVNYATVTNVDQLRILEHEITRQKLTEQLKITFGNYFQKNQLGTIDDVHESISQLQAFTKFNEDLVTFNRLLEKKGIEPLVFNIKNFQDHVDFVFKLPLYREYEQSRWSLLDNIVNIKSHDLQNPLIEKVCDALLDFDRISYELYYHEYFRQRDRSQLSHLYYNLQKNLQKVVPETTNYILDKLYLKESILINESKINEDLFLLKINSFLSSILSEYGDNESLFQEMQAIKRDIERKTADLVVAKTWYYKSKNVTIEELAALSAWLNDLIKVGAGYGKNADRDYASAINNMQIAKSAVPIWIMPLESAITFFPDCSPNQFDLLIIDEASQCDISSLNLIFRSKKALIVGDENQTSVVVDRSLGIDKTNNLLNKYLFDHPFKTQFDVTSRVSSVYAMACVVYPNIVSLREHFRCLPEIIGFSNKWVYSNSIIPLRTATDNIYGDPVEVKFVDDNIMDLHKPKIVDAVLNEILAIIQSYESKAIKKLPSIGIICLDSANNTHIRELNKIILGNEKVKQYAEEIDFLAATSREFQGDERDIIFLTITASHKIVQEKDNIVIKPPIAAASEDFMRIYNVAASRARLKSVLYHSIHPDAIAIMNPECYRAKLIEHYSNRGERLKAEEDSTLEDLYRRVDSNSGEFERSVCSFLFTHNYGNKLYPQYRVGGYLIDFGMIINNKKIAIECDGYTYHSGFQKIRDDIKRQEILERANWQFFRIQSTEWFYKNEHVSRKLLRWLSGIANE